jgi:hypothetical protein
MRSVADLIEEAIARPVTGWDFRWLGHRLTTHPLEWSFASLVAEHARGSTDLLDMSTGGGEWLADLRHRPERTVATESWPPNVTIADARLRPLGVRLVWSEDTPDNVAQLRDQPRGRLPFRAGSFSLIVNRHASFLAAEVARVLSAGGTFLTEQVGGDYADVYEALGLPHPRPAGETWSVTLASRQIRDAGLDIVDSREATLITEFTDVGAFAWYLKAVPWAVPNFTVERYRSALERLHERLRGGVLSTRLPAFFLRATK